jgi:hypothetical protein
MYSELISVSNGPPLGVTARLQPSYFLSCNVAEEAKASKLHLYGSFRSLEVYGEG